MKNRLVKVGLLLLLLLGCSIFACAQGYLHANGKYIYNGNNEEVILRGIGTGNWMINEGYMMKTADFAGTHTQIRQKLIQTIGVTNTNTFYTFWLNNHFTKTDVDSMKVWGFNSIRVAMHYKWLTLPIEEEPVAGQDTWLEEGFTRLDSLLLWCSQDGMYLILDLHGAPGGQGHDANISDYDATKPSLWESAENRRKTVALWAKLAGRYGNEPWMGGYDLINEPNWNLPNGTMLKQLYQQITAAIRAVDHNHLIFIEGNWFANDFTGLTPPWDTNMAYSFHKYWTYNDPAALDWVVNMRNNNNVPIWLGESGENSNSWFTSLIALCESKHIGWSWWPVKKAGINNILKVPDSQKYDNLISYWKTGNPVMNSYQAFEAVMEWSDHHRIQNCVVQRDVIDAMIRQPHTLETIPFKVYHPSEAIPFVNYDLGRNSYAYSDTDTANYSQNTGVYVNWNQGWEYRNDGVDIEKCADADPSNIGYDVGWTADGEWMQYTVDADSAAAYQVKVRSACNGTPGIIHLAIDGIDVSSAQSLVNTSGWQIWSTSVLNNIIFPAGRHKVRVISDKGGSNLGYFQFVNPESVDSVPFTFISARTSMGGDKVFITLNKEITALTANLNDFQVKVNGVQDIITNVSLDPANPGGLILVLGTNIRYTQLVKLSYNASSVHSGNNSLELFTDKDVKNNLPRRLLIPCKIEAEDFCINNGFQFETCTDIGGGKDAGFANPGDYLDYLVYVSEAGEYSVNFRFASLYSNGRLDFRIGDTGTFTTLNTISIVATGGWQVWKNQSMKVTLSQGNYTLRLYVVAGEFNTNWFEIAKPTSVNDILLKDNIKIFPNPGKGVFQISAELLYENPIKISVIDTQGRQVFAKDLPKSYEINELIDLQSFAKGIYLIKLESENESSSRKIVIN